MFNENKWYCIKCLNLLKKCFFIGLTILSSFTNASLLNATPLNTTTLCCISMSNQECKSRPQIVKLIVTIQYFILLVLK